VNATVLAIGSRGDVQPYVALAEGLSHAGHAVRFVTTTDFEGLARGHGLDVTQVPFSVQDALAERSAQRAVEGGGHRASFTAFARIARNGARALAASALAAADGADVVIGGLSALAVGRGLETRTGVPFLPALNVPVDATSAWPGALFPNLRFGPPGASNRWSHRLTRLALALTLRGGGDAALVDVLGVGPLPRWGVLDHLLPASRPVLVGISPAILPAPADWPASRHVVGTWFLDAPGAWRPDSALEAFLAAGPVPVYVGFGSMGSEDPAAIARLVLDAVAAAGVRAIVHRGWARLLTSEPPVTVHFVESVPHTWLLPRVSAAVHHGGAGTTAASLRAGVPTVIVPFHGDQFFWARRVQDLGTGPTPITRRRLTVERLAAALVAATSDSEMRRNAAALGERIQAEEGVAEAVRWIEHTVVGG
jgi:sterol 3beta-glucosyltransferase